MITFVLLSLLSAAFAQYQPQVSYHGYQPQPESYNPQQYQPQGRYQAPAAYQEQPPAYRSQPSYNPQPQPRPTYSPAAVHYVNIGAQLQGDYKFGYDTGKANEGQSFREETRLPDGSVQGAYGYVDDTGKQRIVRYTAGKDGYRVEGDGAAPKNNAPAQPAANAYAGQQNGYSGSSGNYVGNGYQQY